MNTIDENTIFKFCTCGNGAGSWKQMAFNDEHIVSLHMLCGGVRIQNSSRKESVQEKTIAQQDKVIELLEKRLVLATSPWYKRLWP